MDFTIPCAARRERERQNNNRFSTRQNNNFARASHVFERFFAVFARVRREIA